jgi:hypothetical protein
MSSNSQSRALEQTQQPSVAGKSRPTSEVFSLAPIGGEGRGEGAIRKELNSNKRTSQRDVPTNSSRFIGKTSQRDVPTMRRNSQSGIALVITLILLAVITFMAVTFLVVSRREGTQVDTLTSQTYAKEAAEAGAQQSMGQIAAQMQATQNGLNFGLMVSTNWMTNFYNGTANLNDVSYYDNAGKLLAGANMEKMLNNLLILPRPPVFFTTNPATPYNDFRFWLDLNRNGVYDTNGPVVEMNPPASLPVTNYYVGDPEWIGVLNHPDARHSPSNYFVSRFAYIALPIGNSLDVNYIHNDSKLLSASPASIWQDGYLRNQGVGSWELNLAGFLHELNTNWDATFPPQVPYTYRTNMTQVSQSTTFDDATAILAYRVANNYNSLRPFKTLYNGSFLLASASLQNDFIDRYSHGPLLVGFNYSPIVNPDASYINNSPWCGDYSTNQYFSTQDLFNLVPYYQNQTANAGTSFSNHLYSVARFPYFSIKNTTTANSYNRYTFYRMLSQMSFGSASESAEYPYGGLSSPTLSINANYASAYGSTPRMNLNYVNINGTNATNFIPWTPVQFFTNAADRMLRAYFPNPIGVTNGQPAYLSVGYIPIYPTNYYTPAVHRILQLAANMYDASTNRLFDNTVASQAGPFFPSVFKPYFFDQVFAGRSTNVYIAGYVEVGTNQNIQNIDMTLPKDLRRATDMAKFIASGPYNAARPGYFNIYGVPYIIGAKQGFPSFNKFAMTPVVTVSRKVEITKPSASAAPGSYITNIQYNLGISNAFAIDCWYPYTNSFYGRSVTFYVTNDLSISFTNNIAPNPFPIITNIGAFNISSPTLPSFWPGAPGLTANPPVAAATSFKTALYSNVIVVPDSVLRLSPPGLLATTNYIGTPITFEVYNNGNGYLVPRWGVNITNRLRVMMVDTATGRLIDYVQLAGGQLDNNLDINSNLMQLNNQMWSTNQINGKGGNSTPIGIFNQISVGEGTAPASVVGAGWVQLPLPPGQTVSEAQAGLRNFLAGVSDNTTNKQVGYVAFSKFQETFIMGVNDPLVHYTIGDLTDANQVAPLPKIFTLNSTNALQGVLRSMLTNRYQPWGFTYNGPNLTKMNGNEWAYKDPLASFPDMWQFPTNKYPTVGWLGRVHRGTPWQTVYLKSAGVDNPTWASWTGDTNLVTTNYLGVSYIITNGLPPANVTLVNDASFSQPQSDYLLMDLFTTSPNDNASKGQLSINQTNSAAWAAVFDGVLAITNSATPKGAIVNTPLLIDPASIVGGIGGTNMIQYLVNAINTTRTNYAGGSFNSLGQICSVPQLTLNSPFLNYPAASSPGNQGVGDAAYEWIPQQIMSLLRVGTPRYVIFSYGQALKPAPHSIVTSGPYFGMCTNYQVTGEIATRTVVRFDNFPIPGVKAGVQPRAVVESFNVLSPDQ